ncbi:S8 family serine peptidase [Adhaeretor mobilis]|uniref:Subtilase family protein n=1 Tax=Adhaeretor mobilis TaxID=1930276 RepID=A0A517MW58_9BACT|nr:S8 family serine peptidase [Adhaeretor mobilis]QDS99121.1 Subtilase family protein [Adhaeretor mobilis]
MIERIPLYSCMVLAIVHSQLASLAIGQSHSTTVGDPVRPVEFKQIGLINLWEKYDGNLTWGKGQCLAILDDGCNLEAPEWKAKMPWGPKVVGGYDSIDLDSDPTPVPPGYHGTSVGFPSSMYFEGKRGVAYNNSVVHVRGVTVVHLRKDETRSMAAGLQWIIDHYEKYNITAVNLSALDDEAHAKPNPTIVDEKLKRLRELNVWVSAPCGNNNHKKGVSWPACQPYCFAIGATKPGTDIAYLDRFQNTDILVPARATSSSNAIIAGGSMVLREAILKNGYEWSKDGDTLPDAMMSIFKRTGVDVHDSATKIDFKRLDLQAAVESVLTR